MDANATSRPLAWITRDAWLIIVARSLRSFAQAALGILLAVYLDLLGFGLGQIGLFITLGMTGSAAMSLLVVLFGESLGRRRLMAGFTILTGSTALVLTLTDQYLLLAFVAFVSAFNVADGGPAGPIQPLERAAIADTVEPARRTDLFALYSIVAIAARALGALAAGLPVVFQRAMDMRELGSYQVMFVGYAVIAVVAGLLYARLSPSSEAATKTRRFTNPLSLPSRRIIFLMSGLFALDSFGTRLVLQTLVAFWFLTKFGIDLGEVAIVFFSGNVLTALSITVAAKLANRFGLLNTIVVTHVPAVAILFAIAFVPSAEWSAPSSRRWTCRPSSRTAWPWSAPRSGWPPGGSTSLDRAASASWPPPWPHSSGPRSGSARPSWLRASPSPRTLLAFTSSSAT